VHSRLSNIRRPQPRRHQRKALIAPTITNRRTLDDQPNNTTPIPSSSFIRSRPSATIAPTVSVITQTPTPPDSTNPLIPSTLKNYEIESIGSDLYIHLIRPHDHMDEIRLFHVCMQQNSYETYI
jgi:hypothetical protein